MKEILLFILLSPLYAWAQSDTTSFIRLDTLKPIDIGLISGYGRYGRVARSQYMYDGIDVRRIQILTAERLHTQRLPIRTHEHPPFRTGVLAVQLLLFWA